jgi:uncharacterized membrane protein YfcA
VSTTLAVSAAAMVFAGAVQATGGFGFTLAAAPALLAVLPPAEAVSLLTVVAMLANAWLLRPRAVRAAIDRGETRRLGLAALPGLPLGFLLLEALPIDALRALVGVEVLAGVVVQVRSGRGALRPLPTLPAGLLAGTLTVATGANGPPLLLRFLGLPMTAAQRRATLATLFALLSAAALVVLAIGGELTIPATMPLLLALALAGQQIGHVLHHRLSEEQHRWLAVAVLVVTAVLLVVG